MNSLQEVKLKIINTVKEVFEQNMKNLQQAFRDNGFESAAMDVSVGNGGRGGEQKDSSGQKGSGNTDNSRIHSAKGQGIQDIFRSENLIDLTA